MPFRSVALARVVAALLVLSHVAACATRPSEIQPRYMSPLLFGQATCAQLSAESLTLASRLQPLHRRIGRNATVDAIWVGVYVPLVVLLPFTFFLLNGNGAEYEEYSGLLGQRDAVQQQLNAKGCALSPTAMAPGR